MFRGRVRSIHFVGIGGIGMSGIAEVLLASGFGVTGSDARESDVTKRLEELGARIAFGHRAENVGDADVVVFSSAVPRSNPELVEARARAIPVIPRAEMLAELMRLKDGIAIAGSHGKTTTTSLVATVLRDAGLDPTVVIGGKLNALGSNAARGTGDLLVAEADESDGSFLHLTPVVAVITNIDAEHLDHYGSHDKVKDAFATFANRVPFYGLVVACLDHPHVQDILPRIEKRVATYGLAAQADYRARRPVVEGLSTRFELVRRGVSAGEFTVRMPGIHNVLNALAVIAVCDELGVPESVTRSALASFGGVQRRFTIIGEVDQITVVDDYGHHPAEVQATLEAASRAYGRRVVVAFQPHRYTRTVHCFDELTRAFNRADVLLLADVYAAGEAPIEGATSDRLAQAIRAHGHRDVTWVGPRTEVAKALASRIEPGDIVITLGAGDITRVGPELVSMLQARGAGASG
ncbi:UDP-N-acetylmuramate--L-alanine ligase [Sandaracinus amylolyticus]|uniref:UDP-N-acetylmuramate--L-alanine ligase n=1 Tax=Sandaracinus amylolyticus TaxID=927083 RepID=UPI001F032D19|nr:UDP-N-acetylmuramate--L-alanine ligase [Sandaracinus amylolyticus]UJR78948.1 UDP-N-acetylmuramate--L-alanine ligase [Sandaracinus amylolyticus]